MTHSRGMLRVAAIGGDGVGPEVVRATLPILHAALDARGVRLVVEDLDWGGERFLGQGAAMPTDGAALVRHHDAILFGAVGHPDVPDHDLVWGLIIALRQALDLGVNLRPVRAWPGVSSPVRDVEGVDFVVVRENTEGEYTGIGGRSHRGSSHEVGVEVALHSRAAITRAAEFAFTTAEQRSGGLVAVGKGNALRHGYTLWDEVVAEVAERHPDVRCESVLVDAMAARVIENPQSLDVVLASNLFGDILSDLAATLQGGLGMAPSANIHACSTVPGLFEPVHGSAPDIAGTGTANPVACILSGAMLLEHCGHHGAADAVRMAVGSALASPELHTPDLGGAAGTEALAAGVLEALPLADAAGAGRR